MSETTPNIQESTSPENQAKDPLDVLVVFDRLEVGPVRLEPKRLVAPYRVVTSKGIESTELIYRYEEEVFDPKDPGAHNLAAMVLAQVAINYGLFCKEIAFYGLFDGEDRRFLRQAFENTAREIYVNKFLKPNPFLVGEAARLPVLKKKRYCKARLEFITPEDAPGPLEWSWWETRRDRPVILSSGGKDSLLSFGLMRELGYEVHPIFVNESGRHWFTALNAFRHFREHIPHTSRVWTNSDRIFNWFLRQMPFIREDFDEIRADIYPVRLWTVAVFLFGVLPLMRHRGLGRLLIGDEFDTTERAYYEGILHYNGLYDQSHYFDEALSRYYMRKGWGVSQFSVLRPMSDMLIETVLAKRYPDLLALQMSCHAAHKSGERFAPCARCEKCRRIVGMLTSAGISPSLCGYSEEQIQSCLEQIAVQGVSLEVIGRTHLMWTLSERGSIKLSEEQKATLAPHPEIMQLRFDREHSPIDGIPVALRRAIFGIALEYSEGAVRRTGRRWEPFDVINDAAFDQPYPFEVDVIPSSPSVQDSPSRASETSYMWGELTWPEAEAHIQSCDLAILPVGAIEQHGHHLPMDIDSFDAAYLAKRIAEACSAPKPLVMPLIPYGVSYHHSDFCGTLSITNETLARLVYDLGMSAAHNGIKKLLILNGHGGNDPTLNHAAQMINRDSHIFVCVDSGATSDPDLYNLIDTPNDIHAGEIETSTALATRPHLVKMELARAEVPRFSNRYLDFTSHHGVSWHARTKRISQTGVLGDPTKANAEKGRKMWEIMIAHLVALIEEIKPLTLDEIYQRRY